MNEIAGIYCQLFRLQLSSKGSVIVTQASALPAGYRIITPSGLQTPAGTPTVVTTTSTATGGRTPLNFVQVMPAAAAVGTPIRARPQIIQRGPTPLAPAPSGSALRPLLAGGNRPVSPVNLYRR